MDYDSSLKDLKENNLEPASENKSENSWKEV